MPRSFLRQLNDHGIYEQTVAFVAPPGHGFPLETRLADSNRSIRGKKIGYRFGWFVTGVDLCVE